jgi:hypothetical protein
VLAAPTEAAPELRAPRWPRAGWLVPACYLLAAIALTWFLWPDPAGRAPTTTSGTAGISNDVYLTTWSLRYVATALQHGHLPTLVTTALNWPQGANLMWNTSILLPAIVLAPITLLAGPTVSLSILLVLGFAGSAAAMFWVARQWGASAGAAALAGAFYGFSPAMRVAAEAHYHLQLAFLPPLIIHLALRLVTGRAGSWGRVIRTGIWLGLLVAAQFFIAEELLVDTVVAGVIVILVLALSRPAAVVRGLASAGAGLATAAVLALALCGHALDVQLRGPLTETGSPWHVGRYGNQPSDFVTAPSGMLLHGSGFAAYLSNSGQRLVEYFGYLGWPMLILLILLTVAFWRDLTIRIAGVSFVLLELLSMGGHRVRIGPWHIQGSVLPWYWLRHLPVLGQVLPNRLSLLADGAAALVLALAADRIWSALRARQDWRRPVITVTAAAALAVALVPVLPAAMATAQVPAPPPGWQQVVAGLHLRPGAAVLVLPLDGALTMEMQAVTGEPISVVGGYCIAPDAAGHAASCETHATLTRDQQTTQLRLTSLASGELIKPSPTTFGKAIRAWRPTAVITTLGGNSDLGHFLLGYFGRPTAHRYAVMGWRLY